MNKETITWAAIILSTIALQAVAPWLGHETASHSYWREHPYFMETVNGYHPSPWRVRILGAAKFTLESDPENPNRAKMNRSDVGLGEYYFWSDEESKHYLIDPVRKVRIVQDPAPKP